MKIHTFRHDVSFIRGKSVEQQQLQSILRLRELCVKQKTAAGNQLTALLAEFNIKASTRNGGLKMVITATLEDAGNGLFFVFREALNAAWQQYLSIVESIFVYDRCLEKAIEKHADRRKITQNRRGGCTERYYKGSFEVIEQRIWRFV